MRKREGNKDFQKGKKKENQQHFKLFPVRAVQNLLPLTHEENVRGCPRAHVVNSASS